MATAHLNKQHLDIIIFRDFLSVDLGIWGLSRILHKYSFMVTSTVKTQRNSPKHRAAVLGRGLWFTQDATASEGDTVRAAGGWGRASWRKRLPFHTW